MAANIPNEWVTTKLEDVVEILDSLRVPINNTERQSRIDGKHESELYPYYGATGEVGKIDGYIFDEELVALGEDGVPFFDHLKTKAYFLHGKTWVNNHAHVLKGWPNALSNKILLHYLNQFDYYGYVNGGTRLKLTQANMRKIPISLPPLAEQKVIADKLDTLLAQVEAIKSRLERIPNILKILRQSVLASAVSGKLTEGWRNTPDLIGWENVKLDQIVEKIEAGKNLKCIEVPPQNDELGIIKISAVTWGRYDEEQSKTLPNNAHFLESRRIAVGDFLISRANTIELLGNPVIVHEVTKNLMLSDKVLRLVMKEENKPWVSIFLRSRRGRMEIESRSTGNQVSMRNIGQKALLDIELTKPPAEEQAEIVRRVEELFAFADHVEIKATAALEHVNNLTQSILAKAFRGELTADWRAANPELISNGNSAEALLEKIKTEREAIKRQPKPKRSVVEKKTGNNMSKPIKVVEALKQAGEPLSGQQLLGAAGYASDSSAEQLERFFLDIRDALTIEKTIVKLKRSDDGQDWFTLAKTATDE
ncbi:hypothetical protein HPK90_002971 [Salmonella enterica]|nr:hypothetical protein [Salmonella enterica]ECD7240529.1 hypothetical protein [Salmonella enterica subsp. enterica serovar Florida]EDW0490154.1 hypothetical protein [Salmonella enterica subsp. enterica serovar Inverness]HAF7273767.1 hypothetical protein [Salmonella enterica subsp. diarizonae serovar 11:k:z53]EAM7985082.1 hypothetical protein [Salmonella enterica]